MKAMESLLALSALATFGTGAANAAPIATYDVAVTPLDIIFHYPESHDELTGETTPAHWGDILSHSTSYGISGSAVLDDSGTLTITSTYREATIIGTDTTFGNIVTVHGAWDGTTFAATSSTFHFTSCMDNPNAYDTCPSILPRYSLSEFPLSAVSGSANALNGSFTTTWSLSTNDRHYQYVLSNGMPAVPVPAAAWLFVSGLLGLIATVRRRHAA